MHEIWISLTEFWILFNEFSFTLLYSSINKLHFSCTFLSILNNSWNITEFNFCLSSDKSTDILKSSKGFLLQFSKILSTKYLEGNK